MPLLPCPALVVLFQDPEPSVGSGGDPFDSEGRVGLEGMAAPVDMLVLLRVCPDAVVLFHDPSPPLGWDDVPGG